MVVANVRFFHLNYRWRSMMFEHVLKLISIGHISCSRSSWSAFSSLEFQPYWRNWWWFCGDFMVILWGFCSDLIDIFVEIYNLLSEYVLSWWFHGGFMVISWDVSWDFIIERVDKQLDHLTTPHKKDNMYDWIILHSIYFRITINACCVSTCIQRHNTQS